jgi:hypothetical protein
MDQISLKCIPVFTIPLTNPVCIISQDFITVASVCSSFTTISTNSTTPSYQLLVTIYMWLDLASFTLIQNVT